MPDGAASGSYAEYVLGTHESELERLGLQHRLWASEAFACWERAGIGPGTRVLDVGCGPGFTSFDLAALVGSTGRVVAIDESARFLEALQRRAHALGVSNVDARLMDAQRIVVEPESIDAAYARWVLFFVRDPGAVIAGVAAALCPGGVFVIQDYVNWHAISLSPPSDAFDRVMAAILESFRQSGGDTRIGLRIPSLLAEHDLHVEELRPLQRIARAGAPLWAWPSTFFRNYVPLLVERGMLRPGDRQAFEEVWAERSRDPSAFLWAPAMIEIRARKR